MNNSHVKIASMIGASKQAAVARQNGLPRVVTLLASPFRWILEWPRRRDARGYAILSEMRDYVASLQRGEIVWVESVYQKGRRGTKAIVYLERTEERRDVWFWWSHVEPGEIAAVEASVGYGPHTLRDDVLYIGGEHTGSGIHHVMSALDVKRARRHLKRFMDGMWDAG